MANGFTCQGPNKDGPNKRPCCHGAKTQTKRAVALLAAATTAEKVASGANKKTVPKKKAPVSKRSLSFAARKTAALAAFGQSLEPSNSALVLT